MKPRGVRPLGDVTPAVYPLTTVRPMLRLRMLLIASLLGLASGAHAQDDPRRLFERGRAALDDGATATAVDRFEAVLAADPAFRDGEHGSAALWLGRALLEADREEEALTAWQNGLSALDQAGRFDPRLADAFIRYVMRTERTRAYQQAAWAYLQMMEHVGADDFTDDDEEVLDRYVAQMQFLLPDEVKERVLKERRRGIRYLDGAGDVLATWWRAQDPFPATPRNERLEEHLVRVTHALKQYPYERGRAGFDERGSIYVRLGPPKTVTKLRMTDRGIQKQTLGGARSGMELNANEFWSYRHIALPVYYLFVERGGRFQISLPEDLVPESMRGALQQSPSMTSGGTRGDALIEAWQIIYGQLAMLHPDFAGRAVEIDDAINGRSTGQGARSFAQMNRMRYKRQDLTSASRRDAAAPAAYTSAGTVGETLPVQTRIARFLEADGRTRIEVYWAHPSGAFAVGGTGLSFLEEEGYEDSGLYLVNVTAVQKDGSYTVQDLSREQYVVQPQTSSDLAVRTLAVTTQEVSTNIGVQWDQHLALRASEGQVRVGPRVKTAVVRADTLAALSASPASLEMSDLKPIFSADTAGVVGPDREAIPYPFHGITSKTPLALYFEVYHLTYGPDDQVRFTVDYEVRRAGDDEAATFARSVFTGRESTAREFVTVDLAEWDEAGPVEVTLRITDTFSDQRVERTIPFLVVE